MASFVPENWECMNGCDHYFDTVEISEIIDGSLLMSQLLDESHVEDCDDERLSCVIRSLEAEIEPINMMDAHGSFMDLEWDNVVNLVEVCNYSDGGQLEVMSGQDCSTSCDDLDYNWMDMEDMIEFGSVRDFYYYSQYNNNNNNNNTDYCEANSMVHYGKTQMLY